MRLLYVALGGALGSLLRYLAALGVSRVAGVAFPWGTLAVNALGSLAIGLATARITHTDARLFVITGVLGGFTTYSAFNEEVLEAWRSCAHWIAGGYALATIVTCLVAGLLGAALARG